VAALEGLHFEPSSFTLLEGQTADVRLVATYDDGSSKDVTDEATYHVEGEAAEWSPGQLVARRSGAGSLQAQLADRSATATFDVQIGGLRLEVEGAPAPGGEARVLVFAQGYEEHERLLEAGVEFSSSDEAVATVTVDGTVSVHAGGPLTITARTPGHEATWSTVVTCEAPTPSRLLWLGQVAPTLSWPAKDPDGNALELDLASMRCDASWAGTRTVAVLMIAEWCGPCTSYVREMQSRAAGLRELGMEVVIAMIENMDHVGATLDEAYAHVDRSTEQVPGYVVSDHENLYQRGFLRNARLILAFPTVAVIRLDDMRIIAHSTNMLPFEELALLEEGVWEP
jgi:hypothetical protein